MPKPFSPKLVPLKDIDWEGLVRPIGSAHAALGSYSGGLGSILNPAVLLSPLTTREAILSSKMEGTVVTFEEVMEYEADPRDLRERAPDIREVLNYRQALRFASAELATRPACLNLVKDVQRILLEGVRGQNKARGEFRREPVHIGPPGSTIEEATYVPPEWEKVEGYMSNWEQYYHHPERDRLVQMAVLHAQFELIHPFLDGNGRVGRMLIPLFLYDVKLLDSPMFYMSAFLEETNEEYCGRLQAISAEDDWGGWISYFLNGVAEQARGNSAQVQAIMALYDETKMVFTESARSTYAIPALDFLFSAPIFNSGAFGKATRIPRGTKFRLLNLLRDNGTIRVVRERSGQRPAVYAFPRLLSVVNAPFSSAAQRTEEHPASSTDDEQSLPPSRE